MSFRQNINDPVYRKLFGTLFLVFIFLVAISFVAYIGTSNNKSKTVSEYTGPNTKATIVNGDDVYKFIGDIRYLNLRKDLREIATNQSTPNRYLVFRINKTEKPDIKNDSIKFEGQFEDSKLKLSIVIANRPNNRQKQTIINLSNKQDISSVSPSNSKFNQYIETLPIKKDNYIIEYTSVDESITVNQLTRDPNIFSKAKQEIKTAIGDSSYDESRINSLFPPF